MHALLPCVMTEQHHCSLHFKPCRATLKKRQLTLLVWLLRQLASVRLVWLLGRAVELEGVRPNALANSLLISVCLSGRTPYLGVWPGRLTCRSSSSSTCAQLLALSSTRLVAKWMCVLHAVWVRSAGQA